MDSLAPEAAPQAGAIVAEGGQAWQAGAAQAGGGQARLEPESGEGEGPAQPPRQEQPECLCYLRTLGVA